MSDNLDYAERVGWPVDVTEEYIVKTIRADRREGGERMIPSHIGITPAIEQAALAKGERLILFPWPRSHEVTASPSNSGTKPSNPKDAIGSGKLPLELVPDVIPIYAAMAFFEGATKYGRYNWRAAGVRSSIYVAAARRHLAKYWNGEDADPETGVPHLASVLACVGIILDSHVSGKLTDDRPPKQNLAPVIAELEKLVPKLKEMHADKNPKQYTIKDET